MSCFGCRVSGLALEVSGVVFVFRVSCFVFRVSGFGDQVSDFGFRISGFRFRVSGFGFRVSGFRFRVSDFQFRVSPAVWKPSARSEMAVHIPSESPELPVLPVQKSGSGFRALYIYITLHNVFYYIYIYKNINI